jgi:SAM-dependent methyltransferase
MLEKSYPGSSVEDLARRIETKIAKSAAAPFRAVNESTDWNELAALFRAASQNANIGTPPPLLRWSGWRRSVASATARVLLFLLRFATGPQRHYNLAVLEILRIQADSVRKLEQKTAGLKSEALECDRKIEILETSLQRLKADRIIGERRARSVSDATPAPLISHVPPPLLDPDGIDDRFYALLQDEFRGSREDIKSRLEGYLPLLQRSPIDPASPVIEIGSGRGEWLELLAGRGISAAGVDQNSVFVGDCKARGLNITQADAVLHLRSLADASAAAVCGFHVLEHMAFSSIMDLLAETVRVLKPGGVAIFETPNPQNLLVGSWRFYLDPTHLRPLPSPLLKLLLQNCGLARVEVKPLHPFPDYENLRAQAPDDPLVDLLHGCQDYAVIGWRP